jgi:hypothetical protein
MNPVEISNVERVQGTALHRREAEVIFVLPPNHSGLVCCYHIECAGSKTSNDIAIHRIFIKIQPNQAHRTFGGVGNISSTARSSAAMSSSISARLAW